MLLNIFLVLLLMLAMGAVVVAVVRGLYAFANLRPEEVGEDGIPKSLAMQNRMMFARVKWQAIAVILLAIILLGRGATS
jgi:Hypoxia induced protein conserved region